MRILLIAISNLLLGFTCALAATQEGEHQPLVIHDAHREIAAAACPPENATNCANYAIAVHEKRVDDPAMGLELVMAMLERACELNVAVACRNAGVIYYRTGDGVTDRPKSRLFFRRACRLGNADACFDAGNELVFGWGGVKDIEEAVQFYARACILGNANACRTAGLKYYTTDDGVTDREKSLEFHKRACVLENAESCYSAGTFYEHDLIGTRDHEVAGEFYERGCQLGNANACDAGGDIYAGSKAAELYGIGCRLNHASSCSGLGLVLRKAAPGEALDAFEKACELSSVYCSNAAELLIASGGENAAVGRGRLEALCNTDDRFACKSLAEHLFDIGEDQRGTVIKEKSCSLGNDSDCDQPEPEEYKACKIAQQMKTAECRNGLTVKIADRGVQVVEVASGSPAAEAGIGEGDIIEELGQRKITFEELADLRIFCGIAVVEKADGAVQYVRIKCFPWE